jgi:DNA-damage-inducible protein J
MAGAQSRPILHLELASTMGYIVAQENEMATNDVVRARIDAKTKAEASAVLATIGLTVSDAFRLLMVKVAQEKALPFEPLIPNAKTIAAMEEARRGELIHVGTVSDLMAELNADD